MNAKPERGPQPPQATENSDQPIDDVPLFKRKRIIITFSVLLIAVVGFGWMWYMKKMSVIATDDAYVEAYKATISSKILGKIVKLAVDEGDTVHAGDTIVKLDDADLRAQLQKAEASLRYLTRNVEVQSVNQNRAIDDFTRVEKEFKSQIVSQEQFNHADNAKKLAEAHIDMASAQIATAQADLAIVKTQIANTVIIAPFTGVVAKRWVLSGDIISPGQAIFSMFDNKHSWVTAQYEETKLRIIRPGMAVRLTLDAYPGAIINGKVESIGRSTASEFSLIPASNAAGNFTKITQRVPVKISIVSVPSSVSLLPGLSAYVNIFPK